MKLERTLSDLANQAYGLTPAEIDLMWKTAPPRIPIPPWQQDLGERSRSEDVMFVICQPMHFGFHLFSIWGWMMSG